MAITEGRRWPNVHFAADIPISLPPIAGDRTYVDQVLRNLIGNAGKYSQTDGAEVRIEAVEVAEEIVVRVLDRGPGLRPRGRVAGSSTSSSAPGAHRRCDRGPGSASSSRETFVEMMGGRVWALPRDGGGSEFGFALPVMQDDVPVGAGQVDGGARRVRTHCPAA